MEGLGNGWRGNMRGMGSVSQQQAQVTASKRSNHNREKNKVASVGPPVAEGWGGSNGKSSSVFKLDGSRSVNDSSQPPPPPSDMNGNSGSLGQGLGLGGPSRAGSSKSYARQFEVSFRCTAEDYEKLLAEHQKTEQTKLMYSSSSAFRRSPHFFFQKNRLNSEAPRVFRRRLPTLRSPQPTK